MLKNRTLLAQAAAGFWLMLCLAIQAQVLPAQATPAQASDEGGRKITASLLLESGAPAPGAETTLAITMSPAAGWHGYWLNPGDAGFPLKVQWQLPDGVTIGGLQYSAPERLLTSGLMNYIYHGDYALLTPLHIDEDLPFGSLITLTADLRYLVCSPKLCLPEQQRLHVQFSVGDGGATQEVLETFDGWRQQLPRPIVASAEFSIQDGQLALSLPLPESVQLTDSIQLTDFAHLYPEVNGVISNTAPQNFIRKGDRLLMTTTASDDDGDGEEDISDFYGVITLNESLAVRFRAVRQPEAALVFPTSSALTAQVAVSTQEDYSIAAIPPEAPGNPLVTAAVAVFGAVLGGLLLNLMPCVFPILSLKVLSLTNLGDERTAKTGALAYTLGAVLVCVLLGALILMLRAFGLQVGWAFQLQRPEIIVALILLMMAIGLNLAGLFELGTLSSGSKLQQKPGPAGDFWTGVLAAFVATPCTGPFMATALGAAMVLPTSVGLMVFAGLGLGMALPFLLVGFIPALRKRMPRPGAWMLTAKRCFAVPMFLTALGLVWVLMQQADRGYLFIALLLLLLLSLGLWLMGLLQRSGRHRPWWPLVPIVILVGGTLMIATPGGSNHLGANSAASTEMKAGAEADAATESVCPLVFDEASLSALVKQQDVFVYFSADWCLTCQVNEKVAIERQETQAAFARANTAVMLGDWTKGDPAITRFLAKNRRSGVPLYLWYSKGNPAPQVLPQLLTPSLLIEKASAGG